MANGVNTEWFDLQVKHGNYLPKEKEQTLYEIQKEAKQKHEEENKLQNKLDRKNMQQLKEMDDDLDFDDEFMKEYMDKRKNELIQRAKKAKYGQLIEISRNEYVKEVTQNCPEDFVVIHLYQDSIQFCHLVNNYLAELAVRQPHIKFVKMVATKCIEKFPDNNCPCFIIYKGGKPVSHIINVDKQIDGVVNKIPIFLLLQGVDIQESV